MEDRSKGSTAFYKHALQYSSMAGKKPKRIAVIDRDLCSPQACGFYLCREGCPVNRTGPGCINVCERGREPPHFRGAVHRVRDMPEEVSQECDRRGEPAHGAGGDANTQVREESFLSLSPSCPKEEFGRGADRA